MVSGVVIDILASPIEAVKKLHQVAISAGNEDDFASTVSEYFSTIFEKPDILSQIPMLDVSHPPNCYPPGSLVSFRGMIQDTSCSPELYLLSSHGAFFGGWGGCDRHFADITGTRNDFSGSGLKERKILWATNIPGESSWCTNTTGAKAFDLVQEQEYDKSMLANRFPIPELDFIVTRLNIYDKSCEDLKPTDLRLFVGILKTEHIDSDFSPSGLVAPNLHVLFHRDLPMQLLAGPSLPPAVRDVRESLISWLSVEALGGDTDAAEWVLLSCIGQTRHRNLQSTPLTIALTSFPTNFEHQTPRLSYALAEILPLHVFLQLTLNMLNTKSFEPESKNEELGSGVLQLPKGTLILVSEHAIGEGSLNEMGVGNVQALQELARTQTIHYNFPYSRYVFKTISMIIALTSGKTSMLFETCVNVPLCSKEVNNLYGSKESMVSPPKALLDAFRYLISAARSKEVTIDDDVSEYIKEDFVQQRKQDRQITHDCLIRQMTYARLVAASLLGAGITIETWKHARALDSRRRQSS